ncbi:MAG TPA: orotate phosphoribosyltransferase, partial [Actinomycetota bacterium]|nr:orotate phosphoribosyltransferase [Actinomycetota bacterium]
LARAAGAKPLGVAALVDRTNVDPGFELRALVRIDARTYDPNACPLCRAGVPLTERGSRSL